MNGTMVNNPLQPVSAPSDQTMRHDALTARQIRRIMVDMCLRRQKPGTGSDLTFLKRRTAMTPWPDLRTILQNIPWVIVGGVATRAYMPERATKDMHILVKAADGDRALARLKAAGYLSLATLGIPGYALQSPAGIEIDLLLGDDAWLEEALADAGRDAAGYPVLALPYLVLTKLTSMRSQDWADVSRMVGLAEEAELDRVRAVVRRYSPQDLEDLEALIILGQRELQTPGAA